MHYTYIGSKNREEVIAYIEPKNSEASGCPYNLVDKTGGIIRNLASATPPSEFSFYGETYTLIE